MKRLVIINGVTGAIGSACLALFSRLENTTIYGFSRQARPWQDFLTSGCMPDCSLVCNPGPIELGAHDLLQQVNFGKYQEVIYIHAVGKYAFEIDGTENDHDNDGIDDEVVRLSHTAFFAALNNLATRTTKLNAIIFGGLADQHQPNIIQSWWKTMARVKATTRELVTKYPTVNVTVLNISSVVCPHELITRPFVFRNTDAEACYWLLPHEVAEEVVRQTTNNPSGLTECELFYKAGYYHKGYFENEPFTRRKRKEYGIVP